MPPTPCLFVLTIRDSHSSTTKVTPSFTYSPFLELSTTTMVATVYIIKGIYSDPHDLSLIIVIKYSHCGVIIGLFTDTDL